MTEQNVQTHWRFWPVLCLVFIFAFSSPIVMLAAPIYYIQQHVEIIFISLLSTALTITYSISPIILNKISDRLGRRKSVIIALIGATGAQLVFFISLHPIVFLIERLFEGFILGFFFPNLQASISDNAEIDHQKYLARFNLSWGIAGVFGLLFGAVFLTFIDDLRFLFYINPIFLALNVVIAILFFQEPIHDEEDNQQIEIEVIRPEDHQKLLNSSNFYIPVILPLLFILGLSFASGNGTLLYPIKSEVLGFQPSSTFLVVVFATITQSLAMYLSNLVALKKLKLLTSLTLLIYALMFIFFIINEFYFIFIVLFMLSGFFYGILYGTASRLFLSLNIIKDTSIYSSISESSIGLFFFISQIILGIIAGINVNFAYISLSIILVLIFIINLIFQKNFKEV
ncbi:MAG: MFS transporter [Candidatus Lokiarchaeota archaeon]|nr:MFS transporter [Candidatus Lokiarchaeota archaeon]